MAYPASNFFEKAYRNSIDDVASYFNEYHKDKYLIINVSSRPYDYSKFGGRVREYEWPDHQAPPMATLVEIASQIKEYLGSTFYLSKRIARQWLQYIAIMEREELERQSSLSCSTCRSMIGLARRWPSTTVGGLAVRSMESISHVKLDTSCSYSAYCKYSSSRGRW
jgi:hypothetical protein